MVNSDIQVPDWWLKLWQWLLNDNSRHSFATHINKRCTIHLHFTFGPAHDLVVTWLPTNQKFQIRFSFSIVMCGLNVSVLCPCFVLWYPCTLLITGQGRFANCVHVIEFRVTSFTSRYFLWVHINNEVKTREIKKGKNSCKS